MLCARLYCAIFLIAVQSVPLPASAPTTNKKHTIRVRLYVEMPRIPVTSMGRNQQIFLAEQQLRGGGSQIIKLSYDYLYYEERFPAQALDSGETFDLRAQRDPSCDESLGSLGSRISPSSASLQTALGTAASHILECYRTTPGDYRSAHRTLRR